MKYVSLSMLALLSYTCNDALTDELFEKQVLLTKNGWIEQNIDITESEEFDLPVAVSVNGTTENDKNVIVQLRFDSVNLADYNFEKYRLDSALYYKQLPVEVVSFKGNSDRVTIPAGDIRTISHLSLDIANLEDVYGDYVIPITIDTVFEYKKAADYYKALYHIVLKNKYSGNYGGELKVYKTKSNGDNDESETAQPITVNTKTLYAIGKQQCYFYAAHFDRSEWKRDDYIINFTIDDDNNITLTTSNEALKLVQEKATITTYNPLPDKTDNRYEILTMEIDLSYKVFLPSLSLKYPVRVQGKINKSERVLKKQQ
jgi:hypothetical protein